VILAQFAANAPLRRESEIVLGDPFDLCPRMFPSSRADAAAHMPSSPRWHGCGRLSPCLTARSHGAVILATKHQWYRRHLLVFGLLFTACDPKPSHADTSRRCHQSETWSKGTHSKAASISPIKRAQPRGEASSRGGARSAR
jgi:hypothetical protein